MEAIIKALLYIAERQQTPLAIDPDDGKVYIVGESNSNVARLHPIEEPSQTVAIYDTTRLITLHNKPALQRYCNGLITDLQQIYNDKETVLQRSENGNATETQRNYNGFVMDQERTLIGAGKVNLTPFSGSCPAEVAELASNVERLLNNAINNTNKPATLENLMKIHRAAAQYAAAGNIYKLKQIEKRLQGIINKQAAIKTSENTLRRRNRRRLMLFKIVVAVFAIIIVVVVALSQFKQTLTPTTAGALPTLPRTTIEQAFAEWEEANGRRLWPKGRECITAAAIAAGIQEDKEKILILIDKNTK